MNDPLNVQLHDQELMDEVELTTSLIVAANQAESHLSSTEIDAALGVALKSRPAQAKAGPPVMPAQRAAGS